MQALLEPSTGIRSQVFAGRVDVSSIKIVRRNNFVEDRLRPRDAKLVDSSAEIDIERDLHKFVERLQETKTQQTSNW